MNYKLLMESWRRFLNEQAGPDALQRGFGVEKAAQMRKDAETEQQFQDDLLDLELEYPDAFEAEQEQDKDIDRTFPVYKNSAGKERNFINPTKGGTLSDEFDQKRGFCDPPKGSDVEPKEIYHNAIDIYGTKGSPFLAVADGVVTGVVGEATGYNEKVAKLAKGLIKIAKNITNLKKSTPEETIEKLKQVKVWDDIRAIQKKHLKPRSVSRYIRRTRIMGSGGMSVTIKTNADQNGKQWFIYGSHLDSVDVSIGQRVTAGQTLGTCGNSTIAESRPHLHLEVWLPRGSDVSKFDEPEIHTRQKIWRSCAERGGTSLAVRAQKIFPKLKGARQKQGIYQNN